MILEESDYDHFGIACCLSGGLAILAKGHRVRSKGFPYIDLGGISAHCAIPDLKVEIVSYSLGLLCCQFIENRY